MAVLLLPDLVAMMLLVLVLGMIRRRFAYTGADLWMIGLLLVVVECAARMLYLLPLPAPWHHAMHAVGMNGFWLEGMVFLWSALPGLRSARRSWLYLGSSTAPFVLLMTMYGMEGRSVGLYHALALASMAAGVTSARLLRQGWRYAAANAALWMPVLFAARPAELRVGVYLALALLYLGLTLAFAWNLPRQSKGRLLVVAGFACMTACLGLHPWVGNWGRTAIQLSAEVWSMQKFLITLGFVLLLMECRLQNAEWMATHDDLTGLPNRRMYDLCQVQALLGAERSGSALLLFNLDLEGFKAVNDTLGHDAGDTVLRHVSQNLEGKLRRTDTLARLGGDEFRIVAMALEENPQEQACRLSESIRRIVEEPVEVETAVGRQTLQVSTSIGWAMFPMDGRQVGELCRIADERMYRDKAERRRASREHAAERMPLQGIA